MVPPAVSLKSNTTASKNLTNFIGLKFLLNTPNPKYYQLCFNSICAPRLPYLSAP